MQAAVEGAAWDGCTALHLAHTPRRPYLSATPGPAYDHHAAAPARRVFAEVALACLQMMHLLTLMPFARRFVVGATVGGTHMSGMAIILKAAHVHAGAYSFNDPDAIFASLQVGDCCWGSGGSVA